MARINVYDSIYRDPRFVQLCAKIGSMEEALGTMVLLWDAAQRSFWEHDPEETPTVPVADLKAKLKHFEAVASVGLVRLITTEEAYVCGSLEAFTELRAKRLAQREKGKIGGKRSAEVRENKKKGSQSKPRQAGRSRSKPEQAQPTSSTSTSTSKEGFPSENTPTALVVSEDFGIAPQGKPNPVAIWCREYARAYGFNPLVGKQEAGMLAHFAKGKTPSYLQALFCAYLAIKTPLYEDAKHPLSLFLRDKAKIHAAAQTGIDPSKGPDPLAEWNASRSRSLEAK